MGRPSEMKSSPHTRRIWIVASPLCGLLLAACLAQSLSGPQDGAARRRTTGPPPAPLAPPKFDAATDLVVFPDEKVELLCGPQLKAGSARNPYKWFDRVQLARGHALGEQFPAVAPRRLTGKVSALKGSRIIEGSGTRFKSEVDPNGPAPLFNGHLRVKDAGGTFRDLFVTAVESDTRLTLQSPWPHPPVADAEADTSFYDPASTSWNHDRYYDTAYYDLALVQYVNYYRTGDPAFLAHARKTADSWWASPYIDHGTVTSGPNNLPPRSMAYAGLMLRALDGRPEMWDYLHRQARDTFDNWVGRRVADKTIYYDMREDGFAQLYAVLLAKVLPDSYDAYPQGTLATPSGRVTDGAARRAALLRDTTRAALNFFGRLQRPDGSWRWDVDIEGTNLVATEQPFMVGLYLESVVALDRITQDPTVKASLRTQLEKSVRHLYTQAYRGSETVSDMPQYKWRGMWYFWGGGTRQDPTLYERGRGAGEMTSKGEVGMISQVRHLNSTVHHAFGYAYAVTGDEELLRMGEDVFDASYGERVDGIRGQADTGRGKDYAMNFRASGRYLAWRLSGPAGGDAALTTRGEPHELIATAFSRALGLSKARSPGDPQIRGLLDQVEAARRAFSAGAGGYAAPEAVLSELDAALGNVRTALAAARAGADASDDTARQRVEWAAARLKRASERVRRR